MDLVEDGVEEAESSDPTTQAESPDRSLGETATETNDEELDSALSEQELEEIVKQNTADITVVGCGGGGGNTVARMMKEGIEGAELLAINTDARDLRDTTADKRLLIGKRLTGGKGAGADPRIGEEAALEDQDDISRVVSGNDMVFVTAGMGGGTGTGSAPVVAAEASDAGALTIAVVTVPFDSEGEIRKRNAEHGIQRLREVADTVIVIPNERITAAFGNLPVQKAFKQADNILTQSVRAITNLITSGGVVNVDFADIETVMKDGGVSMIGIGSAEGRDAAGASIENALSSDLLDVDITSADGVLMNVEGDENMTINDAEGVAQHVYEKIEGEPRIIWGSNIDPDLNGTIRTTAIITGVRSPQIYDGDVRTPDDFAGYEDDYADGSYSGNEQTGDVDLQDDDDDDSDIIVP